MPEQLTPQLFFIVKTKALNGTFGALIVLKDFKAFLKHERLWIHSVVAPAVLKQIICQNVEYIINWRFHVHAPMSLM